MANLLYCILCIPLVKDFNIVACPSGTYKSDDNTGDVRTCIKCPDDNHVTEPGATSVEQCVCRKGYRNFNSNGCAGDDLFLL